jgi:hypothetical protein
VSRTIVLTGRTSQALILALVAACGSDNQATPDAPADAAVDVLPDAYPMVQLESSGTMRPLSTYYSFYSRPLPLPDAPVAVTMVVTFIDPAFTCSGPPSSSLDTLSFGFQEWLVGARSQMVLGRSGPVLGAATGGVGEMRLSVVDDRFMGETDGGADVTAGGHLEGMVDYSFDAGVSVRGRFYATYCRELDFVQ